MAMYLDFETMTTENLLKLLEDIKKSVQVAAHYTTHIGIAPSSYLTGLSRKYHYQKYVSTPPCNCYTFMPDISRSTP